MSAPATPADPLTTWPMFLRPHRLGKARIVGFGERLHQVIRLGVQHVGVIGEQPKERRHVQCSRADPAQTGAADGLDRLSAGLIADRGQHVGLRRAPELDQHFARRSLAPVHPLDARPSTLGDGRRSRRENSRQRREQNRQTDDRAIHRSSILR